MSSRCSLEYLAKVEGVLKSSMVASISFLRSARAWMSGLLGGR
jgi:hypothetical protein